jgi:hypothetical protein
MEYSIISLIIEFHDPNQLATVMMACGDLDWKVNNT